VFRHKRRERCVSVPAVGLDHQQATARIAAGDPDLRVSSVSSRSRPERPNGGGIRGGIEASSAASCLRDRRDLVALREREDRESLLGEFERSGEKVVRHRGSFARSSNVRTSAAAYRTALAPMWVA